ncbi:hypothetical protein [Hymenobacter koreensis]|uniref:DUF2244 domain-containing protein n=1 Tax=Hymenobacter koreensis TaxID=1084523 RepID=A0ABP8IT33_9BACT
MREVRYVREQGWAIVALGALAAGAGVALAVYTDVSWIIGAVVVFVGAVIAHIGRLQLQEPDVLLRFTADRVWTKEFGWQKWSDVEIRLYKSTAHQSRQFLAPGQLEIRLPHDANRRFIESIGNLDISYGELMQWLRSKKVKRLG